MLSKSYPQAKRATISKRPKEEIMAFCKEIDIRAWKSLALKLPPINGFRRGSDAEIKGRFRSYIGRIDHWKDNDWELFSDLWLAWIKSHPLLDELLKQYDNKQDFQDEITISPNSQLDIGCFEFLLSSSDTTELSRELLKRFYDYGYFLEDQKIEYIISNVKSELEIKVLKFLDQIEEMNDKIIALEKLSIDSRDNTKKIEININQIDHLNSKVSMLENGFKQSQERVEQELDDRVNLRASSLEKEIENLSEYCSELTDSLRIEFNKKFEEMAALLNPEITALIPPRGNKQETEPVEEGVIANRIFFERIFGSDAFFEYDSIDKLEIAFVHNFKSIGMTSSGAKQFSKEIIASILSQGTITFKGSFASVLAQICAKTISSTNTSICYIPVGLLDGNNFRTIFDRFQAEALKSDLISTLIIEGVNLSSIEAFAPRLNKYIGDQAIGINQFKSIIICTLISGPASLDCPLMLCDSGPVFDTDCLEWREKWEISDIEEGVIPKIKFDEWIDCSTNILENWNELYEEFNCIGGFSTVLRDRFVQKAAIHIANAKGNSSVIQSLAFGWFIPRGIALNIDFTLFKELIAEGKLDAEKSDKRINKLLALSF